MINLIKSESQTITVEGANISLVANSPIVQAELVKIMSKSEGKIKAQDIVENVKLVEYYFTNIITNVEFNKVTYTGQEFFNMLNFIDEGTQAFITETLSEIIGVYFLTEKTKKKQ